MLFQQYNINHSYYNITKNYPTLIKNVPPWYDISINLNKRGTCSVHYLGPNIKFGNDVTNKEIAELFDVQYQTTLLIFKDKKLVYRSIGETTKDLIYKAIQSSI